MKVFGKIILSGEHAVVYGEMALVAQISLGVQAKVVEGKKATDPIVKKAVEVAGGENVGVEIASELPIGAGLGSSAAVATATIKAVRNYLGKTISKDELFNLTMECERIAHGNPSGIDPAAVVYGGLIAFVKGKPMERLQINRPISMILANSGKPEETTKDMVELVAKKKGKDAIITQIGMVARNIKDELVKGGGINNLINENGVLLEKLGVVGDRALALARELRDLGAAVKITGAGGVKTGSGMMIVLHPDLSKIVRLLDNKGIEHYKVTIGEV